MVFDLEMIKKVYASFPERVTAARKIVGRPLTLTEKILYTHLWQGEATATFERGKSYVDFAPGSRRHAGCYRPDGPPPVHAGRSR